MSDAKRCEHGDLLKMLDDAWAARDASVAARKEAEDSLDHERVRHSETQAELDEIGRILDERYRLLKVRHDALAATVERVRALTRTMADEAMCDVADEPAGRVSCMCGCCKSARAFDAALAPQAIGETLRETLDKVKPPSPITDAMVEAAARELDWSNDWTGQRIDEVREGDPGGLSLKTARRILEAAERVR